MERSWMQDTSRAASVGLVLACMLAGALAFARPAFAGSAWWHLSARSAPTYLPPGGTGLIDVSAEDLGNTGVTGATSPIVISDMLPEGFTVTEANAVNPHRARVGNRNATEKEKFWKCEVKEERAVSCSTSLAIPAFEPLELEIPVQVHATTSASNEASVSGGEEEGGDPLVATSLNRPLQVSDQSVPFGVEEGGFSITPEAEGGALDTLAGSHPYQLTSVVEFNQTIEEVQEPGAEKKLLEPAAPAVTKDLSFQLPPGLLGSATAAERCSGVEFSTIVVGNLCPPGSAVGVATVTILEPSRAGYITLAVPLFNLEPAEGEPARFGFVADAVPVILDTSVRTDEDYGVTVSVNNASAAAQVLGATVSFWGDPSSEQHDGARGWACLRGGIERNPGETCTPPSHRSDTALLTLPTSCEGELRTLMEGDAWTGQRLSAEYTLQNPDGDPLQALTGCQSAAIRAFTRSAARTTGRKHRIGAADDDRGAPPPALDVAVKVAQQGTIGETGPGDADVRSATVTLPQGMMLNPSAANGLAACSETQIGYLGLGALDPLAPAAPEPMRFSSSPASCPEASKLGTVQIKTPLLPEELHGSVYLAAQQANPFDSLIALYLVAENPKLGIRAKLAGQGSLNEQTGQVTTTFTSTPQVPFEELKIQLFGGQRGSLTTPAQCGTYTTTSSFTAWSGTVAEPQASEPFTIASGPGGAPCANPLPFSPLFAAGVDSLQAGAFTTFTLTIGHPDADQRLNALSMRLPAGVAALLATVTPCAEPAPGHSWACGPESLIGHSTAWAGLGSEPVALEGSVYLTTGYGDAPFGLLDVTPAVAGPFNLGDVYVRSRINVDPNTAQVTITSDPFPAFVQGVPAQIKQLNVTVDRPGFEFNPTSCSRTSITGTLTGAEGATTPVSSPFQASGCADLPFHPSLTASSGGHASKQNGTSFQVKVTSQGLGVENIAKVDLAIPGALPSRQSTLKKACTGPVFEANPAGCSPESVIGMAVIHTPVLRNPLSGPAYLVSHGNAAFPDVEFLLQGEGISVLLDGSTDIKKGVTYSRFESAPDAPFTTFETILPAGPHGILTAYANAKEPYNLCSSKLTMPTEITAQNGTVIKQDTKVAITGCQAVASYKTSRAKKLAKALKHCRTVDRHSRAKRLACERKARHTYHAHVGKRASTRSHLERRKA